MFTHFNVTCLLQTHQSVMPKVYLEAKTIESAKVFPFIDNETFSLRGGSIFVEIGQIQICVWIRTQRLLQFPELGYVESFYYYY